MCVTYLGDLALKYCMRWEQGLLIPAYVHVYKVEFRMPLRNLMAQLWRPFTKNSTSYILIFSSYILIYLDDQTRLAEFTRHVFIKKLLSCQKKSNFIPKSAMEWILFWSDDVCMFYAIYVRNLQATCKH